MKGLVKTLSFLWSMLIVGIVVNAGFWLATKGVGLVFAGFGRLTNRNKNV